MSTHPKPIDLSVSDITVSYSNGHTALYDVGFQLNAGTICALVGINGSGKSSLFKCIMGFMRPSKGHVLINGGPVNLAHRQSWVAYVPQSEDVDWSFPVSVWDVVLMGRYGYMNFLRNPSKEDKAIALTSLARVNMDAYKDRQIGELSGGQKKRVFLARALAQKGRLILLDEPFTGVDIQTEAAIIQLLRELRAEGHIVLVSTHDLGSVPTFCDQVVIVNRTLVAAGPMATTFTEANLSKAFGGALRHLKIDHTDTPGSVRNAFRILTDDEDALVFDQDGKAISRTRHRKKEDRV
jgi:manganese/iron transport system ATP-binding protein